MEQKDIITRLEAIEEKLSNGAIWELPSVIRSIGWLIADVEDRGCACGSSPPGFVGQDGIHCGCCGGILGNREHLVPGSCPECGHPIDDHRFNSMVGFYCNQVGCKCDRNVLPSGGM